MANLNPIGKTPVVNTTPKAHVKSNTSPMTEDPNKKEIEGAALEEFLVLDEANRCALINFNPNDPKLELKRALGLKASLEHRG